MLSAFALAALTWTGMVRVEHVILLAAFNGTVASFDMPGRQSFVVEMVGYEDLANAIALNSMMFNSARMLGPAAAGLLIAWLGIGTCFFLNGVSFLAVIWSLFQMDIPSRAIAGAGARMFPQLREGLAYVWSNGPIFYQMVLAAVTNGFGYQYLVLVPVFARNVLARRRSHLWIPGRGAGTGFGGWSDHAGLARARRGGSGTILSPGFFFRRLESASSGCRVRLRSRWLRSL